MNAFKKFFSRCIAFFKSPKLDKALATTYDVMQIAMPFVEVIAQMTPNKADDEIVAVIKEFAVPVAVPTSPMTDLEKSMFLKTAAVTAVKKEVNKADVPDSVINAAVELAYLAVKSAA
jgi:hypothetical protein